MGRAEGVRKVWLSILKRREVGEERNERRRKKSQRGGDLKGKGEKSLVRVGSARSH